jgi:CheY-like chemotaxis protein
MEPAQLVLVVDDDAATRAALQAVLAAAGYRVACAADGREAIDYLGRAERPGLILLDLSMPVMDGWQFRVWQRQAPAWAPIPVVLVSAEADLARIATSLGVVGYFAKPIDFDGLLDAVRVLGGGHSPALLAG